MFLRFRNLFSICLIALAAVAAAAQVPATPAPTAVATPLATPAATPQKVDPKNLTAEQVVEFSLFFYGGGRDFISQIRKTTLERGVTMITNGEGKTSRVPYQKYIIRGGSLAKEKIRLDQEFPDATYSMVQSDEKIFGVYNNTVFVPRDLEYKVFENQIVRSIDALHRYKENESTVALAAREKLLGVDYYVLDVTDKQGRKTRFYVSAKSYRILMLTYEEDGVKYRRKFYDYNPAQNTLVPFRSVLWANDKIVEETEVGTITFGQKVEERLFNGS